MNRLTSPSHIDTDALERETGFGWGWFIVLGAALIVLGALAFLNLPPTGTVSVYAVGVVMMIGALAQLGTTLLVPRWRGIGLLVLSAILYGAAAALRARRRWERAGAACAPAAARRPLRAVRGARCATHFTPGELAGIADQSRS